MRRTVSVPKPILVLVVFALAAVAYTTSQAQSRGGSKRWSYQDWPTGHYKVADNWPPRTGSAKV